MSMVIESSDEMNSQQTANDEVSQKLKAYSKEIDSFNVMSIDDLIASHRRIRQNFIQVDKDRKEQWAMAQDDGYKAGLRIAQESVKGAITIEALSKMTIGEIYEHIHNHS